MADVYPDPLPRATNMTNSSLSSLAQTRRAALLDTNIILDDATAIVPFEQKNAIAKRIPLLLIVQRFLNRLRPGISLDTVLALIAIYMAGKPVYESLEKFFYSKLTSQVKISERQQIGRDVLAYMTDTVLCTDSSYKATVVSNGAYDENDILNSMMLTRYRRTTNREPQGRSVQYLPWMGQTRLFWVGYRPFLFSYGKSKGFDDTAKSAGGAVGRDNKITITTPGWSLQPLKDLIDLCQQHRAQIIEDKTIINFMGTRLDFDGPWSSVEKTVRKLDTIDIDDQVKTDIIRDAEEYYSTEGKKFYTDCGIPYRRGYLFYGPPGTGKTSLCAALAGHLKCELYMINLSSPEIGDAKLQSLFLTLPKKCIVVIEDIDVAGIDRREDDPKRARAPGAHRDKRNGTADAAVRSPLLEGMPKGDAASRLLSSKNNLQQIVGGIDRQQALEKQAPRATSTESASKEIPAGDVATPSPSEEEILKVKKDVASLSASVKGILQKDRAARVAPQKSKSLVTLSGLLNAIDGNASQEGRLLIMTSNKPDNLDEALKRPGRIDKMVHLGYLSKPCASSMFKRLVGRSAIRAGKYTEPEIETKAALFAEQFLPDTFTPAEVQNFLQSCRGDPDKAIAELDDWQKQTEAKLAAAVGVTNGDASQANGNSTPVTEVDLDVLDTLESTGSMLSTFREMVVSRGDKTS